jgi:hypothetical protein
MDNYQYKNELGFEKRRLNYLIKRNINIATFVLAISGSILIYDTARVLNLPFKMMNDSRIKEFYFKQKTFGYDAMQSKIEEEKIKEIIKEEYIPKVKKSKDIGNIAKGLAGASGLYFLLGTGISYINYCKKKKSLEQTFKNILC